MEKLMTIKDIVAEAGISRRAVMQMVDSGKLKPVSHYPGGKYYFSRAEVERRMQ